MATVFLLASWIFIAAALVIAWQVGDRADRKAIVAVVAAALLTALSHQAVGGRSALALVAVVDLALLAYMVHYALAGQRYWPVWFAGMQAATVTIGLVTLVRIPGVELRLDLVGGFWSIPALLVMVGGLVHDHNCKVGSA